MTDALADRLERALARASAARTAEIARLPDNPLGIELRTFGGGVEARLVRRALAYYGYFNGPFDLRGDASDAVVAELATWYRQAGAPCYVRLSPLFATEPLLASLAAAGLRQSGFTSVLAGAPPPKPPSQPSDLTVEMLPPASLDTFLDLWTATAPAQERALRRTLAGAEFVGWHCFVARLGGHPAAHAALYLDGTSGTAVLAAAGTLPAFRGRGCQTALVAARLAVAARQGYPLVVVEATPGSASQRNLERAGLRLAYTRVIWTW